MVVPANWPLAAGGLLAESQAALSAGLALVLACATAYAAQSALWLSHIARPRSGGASVA